MSFHNRDSVIWTDERKRSITAAGTYTVSDDREIWHVSGNVAITLAAPQVVGLLLSIVKTDSTVTTLTMPSAIDISGATTITLSEARQSLTLVSIEISGTYYWQAINAGTIAGGGSIQSEAALFTEATQSGGGTYDYSIVVPGPAFITNIYLQAIAVWDDTTAATGIVGDGTDPDGFFTGVNMKATDLAANERIDLYDSGGKGGAYISSPAELANKTYITADSTITATVTVTAGDGTAGRTLFVVEWLPISTQAATFTAS